MRAGINAAAAAADVLRRGSPLRSGDWLRKSASDPEGKSLIWVGAHRGEAASKVRTLATAKPTIPGSISRIERASRRRTRGGGTWL